MSTSAAVDRFVAELAGRIARLEADVRSQARGSQAAFRSVDLEDGPIQYFDENGNVVGEQDQSGYHQYTGAVPVTPTAPDVESVVDGLKIIWDGTFEDGNWDEDQVAMVQVHAVADPATPLDDTTQVGSFVSDDGGVFTYAIRRVAGPRYIMLQAVTTAGEYGPASIAGYGQADAVVPPEAPPNRAVLEVRNTPTVSFVEWLNPETGTELDYHMSSVSGFVPDATNLHQTTAATVAMFATLPDGAAMVPGTPYYVVAIAQNALGTAVASVEHEINLVPLAEDEIASDVINRIDQAVDDALAAQQAASAAQATADGAIRTYYQADPPDLSEAANLITNPSAEVDTAGWAGAVSQPTRVASSEAGVIGGYVLRHDNAGAITSGQVLTRILVIDTAKAGETYTVHGRGRRLNSVAGSETALLYAQCIDQAGTTSLHEVSVPVSMQGGSPASLNTGSLNITIPDGTYYVSVGFRSAADVAAGSAFHFDGFALIEGENQPYFDGSATETGYTFTWTGTPHASASKKYPDTVLGDLWYDTDTDIAHRWNGTSWTVIQDDAIAQALAEARDAQTTADGKITAWYNTEQPWPNGDVAHAGDVGDLWFDTNNGNKPHWYNEAQVWTELPMGLNALGDDVTARALGSITTFTGTANPVGAREGDMWLKPEVYQGANVNVLYRHDGVTPWVKVDDPAVQDALEDAAAASDLADSKMSVYYNAAPPTTDPLGNALSATNDGDLWFDIDDGNRVYRYVHGSTAGLNGGPWVESADARIADTAETVSTLSGQVQSLESGKNTVHHSANSPGIATNVEGDVWFQYADSTLTEVIAQFRGLGGNDWQQTALDPLIVPQIDIGTGTFGTLSGLRLEVGTLQVTPVDLEDITFGGENLADRSSFEDGVDHVTTANGATKEWSNLRAKDGNYSLRGTCATTGADSFLNFTFDGLLPNTVYTVSAWLYVESITGAASGNRSMLVTNAVGPAVGYGTETSLTADHPTGEWVRKSITFTTDADDTSMRVRLYVPNGAVHWDAVQVEEGDVATAYSRSLSDTIGGAVADVKTLWGHPDDSTKIDGGNLYTRSVFAESLLLADFTDYVPNPDFEPDLGDWSGSGSNASVGGPAPGSVSGRVWRFSLGGTETAWSSKRRVSPFDQFNVTAYVRKQITTGTTGSLKIRTRYFDINKVQITNPYYDEASIPLAEVGGWQLLDLDITVPANAAYMRFDILTVGVPADGLYDFSQVHCRRKNGGNLIVDGAIDGKTITGALVQSHFDPTTGIKLSSNDFVAYGGGVPTFSIDGDTGSVVMKGTLDTDSVIRGAILEGDGIRTAASGTRVEIKGGGASGQILFYFNGVELPGNLFADTDELVLLSPGSSLYERAELVLSSEQSGRPPTIQAWHSLRAYAGMEASGTTLNPDAIKVVNGNLVFSGTDGGIMDAKRVYARSAPSTAAAANTYIASDGQIAKSNASTRRNKSNIKPMQIDVAKLLALEPATFTSDHPMDRGRTFAGFMAEDAHALGLTHWLDYDEEDLPASFAYPTWVVALQHIVRYLANEIDELKASTPPAR